MYLLPVRIRFFCSVSFPECMYSKILNRHDTKPYPITDLQRIFEYLLPGYREDMGIDFVSLLVGESDLEDSFAGTKPVFGYAYGSLVPYRGFNL